MRVKRKRRVHRQPVLQVSIFGRRKGEGGKRKEDVRIPHRRIALKDFEDVFVVRVVHLQSEQTKEKGASARRPISLHLLRSGEKRTHLRGPKRSRAFQPEQRHLLLFLLRLFPGIPHLEAQRVFPPLPLIPPLLSASVGNEMWRGEGDGELFGRGRKFEEGVAKPFGLRKGRRGAESAGVNFN
jgi:hypothetical protein